MKVFVCGSIAVDKGRRIKKVQMVLKKAGFQIVDQLSGGLDYSNVSDFRGLRDLAIKITKRDLELVKECDAMVVLGDEASWGGGAELHTAKELGKKIVLLSSKPVASPWPVALSDCVVKDEGQLLQKLRELKEELKMSSKN